MTQLFFSVWSSQALKARLQSSKHTGTNQNLTQNGHSRSYSLHVMESDCCKGDQGLCNTKYWCWHYLLRSRHCRVYERSAVPAMHWSQIFCGSHQCHRRADGRLVMAIWHLHYNIFCLLALCWWAKKNNNNNDNIYGAVIVAQSHCHSSPSSYDEYGTAPRGRQPSDQVKQPELWVQL